MNQLKTHSINISKNSFVFRHCKITHKTKAKNQKNHVIQTPHEAHEARAQKKHQIAMLLDA